MPLSEADTRAKLIDPAIHARGWTEDLLRREETHGAIELFDGRPRRRARGRLDYTLRLKLHPDTQPIAVALIEAKAENLPANHGLEQAKLYAACKRLNVPLSSPATAISSSSTTASRSSRRSRGPCPTSLRHKTSGNATRLAWASVLRTQRHGPYWSVTRR